MITGFGHASIAVRNGSRLRPGFSPLTILTNSRISAPAMKVRPAPMTMMAVDVRVGGRGFDGGLNGFGNSGAQGVHRRVVDGDDGDLFVAGQSNGVAHVATQSSDPQAGVSNGKFPT